MKKGDEIQSLFNETDIPKGTLGVIASVRETWATVSWEDGQETVTPVWNLTTRIALAQTPKSPKKVAVRRKKDCRPTDPTIASE